MIRLNSTTVKLQVDLEASVTTNQLECAVWFYDQRKETGIETPIYFPKFTTTNNTTDVDICDAPPQDMVRNIDTIKIFNGDTASANVRVKRDDGGTESTFVKVTLATEETLGYEHGRGWYVLTATGALKSDSSGEITASWTPAFTFATAGDQNFVYSIQVGRYHRRGSLVTATFNLAFSTFTHTTASGDAQITGLPFTTLNVTSVRPVGSLNWSGITKANYTYVNPQIAPNSSTILLSASGSAQALATIGTGDMPTGGTPTLRGEIAFLV